MQFLIIGKDEKDEKAMERRMAVREAHITLGDKMEALGERWYGCAILDDDEKMIGSMAMLDFPSEKELQEYLKREPYITGKVWKTVEVSKCNVKRPWKFNRPQSFFEDKLKNSK
ncbi:MAG: YciI family protein [Patescibacteria group bacterium]